jgi:hypothetical protein
MALTIKQRAHEVIEAVSDDAKWRPDESLTPTSCGVNTASDNDGDGDRPGRERRISEIGRRGWIAVSDDNGYSGLTEELGK